MLLLLAHQIAKTSNRTKAATPPTTPPTIAPVFECFPSFPGVVEAAAVVVDDADATAVLLGVAEDNVAVAVAEADAELLEPEEELELEDPGIEHRRLSLHS